MADPFTIEFEFKNKRFTDAALGLHSFYEALNKDWDGAAKVLSKELREFLTQVVEAIVQRNSGGWPGGTTDNSLSKRDGKLMAAIEGSIEVHGETFDSIQGSIGAPGVVYARIQELGGTIHAKNAKYLAIPLPAALDASGHAAAVEPARLAKHVLRQDQGRQPAYFPEARHHHRAALRAEDQRGDPAAA